MDRTLLTQESFIASLDTSKDHMSPADLFFRNIGRNESSDSFFSADDLKFDEFVKENSAEGKTVSVTKTKISSSDWDVKDDEPLHRTKHLASRKRHSDKKTSPAQMHRQGSDVSAASSTSTDSASSLQMHRQGSDVSATSSTSTNSAPHKMSRSATDTDGVHSHRGGSLRKSHIHARNFVPKADSLNTSNHRKEQRRSKTSGQTERGRQKSPQGDKPEREASRSRSRSVKSRRKASQAKALLPDASDDEEPMLLASVEEAIKRAHVHDNGALERRKSRGRTANHARKEKELSSICSSLTKASSHRDLMEERNKEDFIKDALTKPVLLSEKSMAILEVSKDDKLHRHAQNFELGRTLSGILDDMHIGMSTKRRSGRKRHEV